MSIFEDETIEDVALTFRTITAGGGQPNGDELIPEFLNGFSDEGSNVYISTIDIEADTDELICLSFTINPTFAPLNPTISVEFEAQVPGCSSSETVDFSFSVTVPDLTLNVNALASGLVVGSGPNVSGGLQDPASSMLWGQNLVINEELIFDFDDDEPYFLTEGSNIILGPDASIVVQSGTLTINRQSIIESCTDLWDAITVEDGATLIIDGSPFGTTSNTVTIKDGRNGIVVEDGGFLDSRFGRYYNNYISIQADGGGGEPNIIAADNVFESDGLKAPLAGQQALAGIDVADINGPAVFSINNVFRGMGTGIIGEDLIVYSLGDVFENLDIGIRIVDNGFSDFLYQYGNGTGGLPSFKNCGIGISTNRGNVFAEQNLMEEVGDGIVIRNGILSDFIIKDNNINASRTGVSIGNWYPILGEVKNNIFSINGDETNGAAISTNLLHIGGSRVANLLENEINLERANYGIRLRDSRRVDVNRNDVNFGNPTSYRGGIQLEAGEQNRLFCNFVDGDNTQSFQTAYRNDISPENLFSCNSANLTQTGLLFTGVNNTSTIQGHNFFDHTLGLAVGLEGVIGGFTGIQNHNGNRWNQAYPQGAGYAHYGGLSEQLNSVHIVDEADGADLTTSTDPASFDAFQEEDGDTFICPSETTGCPPDENGNFGEEIKGTDREIANGNLIPSVFPDAQEWTAKRQLYRRLLEYPALQTESPEITAFFQNETNTTVGKLENVRAGIAGLYALNATEEADLKGELEQLRQLNEDLLDIELQLVNETDATAMNSLNAQKQVLKNDLATLTGTLDAKGTSLEQNRITVATQLLAENQAIGATDVFESNQLTYNRIYLEQTIGSQTDMTPEQKADLQAVALQCPYAGGEAVYQARALLDDGAFYDDFNLCAKPGGQAFKKLTVDVPFVFSVSPNPSNGFVKVELETALNSSGTVTLLNAQGVQLRQVEIEEGEQHAFLFLDGVPSGTYYLTVETASGRETQIITNLK